MSRRPLVLPVLILATCALTACGRRGPLEPPPGSTPPPQASVVSPAGQTAARTGGLARDTSGADSLDREQVLAPASPIIVPKTPFILDPLL